MTKSVFDEMNSLLSGRGFFGFDETFKRLAQFQKQVVDSYPPYNIKKVDENKYTVEIAVAGFASQQLDITLDGGRLVVTGRADTTEAAESFLHKGIAGRAFVRSFPVADTIEVKGAELINGMLKITLENVIAMNKAVKIDITSGPQVLNEEGKK